MAWNPQFRKHAAKLIRNRFALFHNVAETYNPSITQRKERLIEVIKEKAEIASKTEWGQKLRRLKDIAVVEMSPPGPNDMRKLQMDLVIVKEFISSGCWKHLTVKQALLLFLVAWEISLWFYLGETFGKFHIVGYDV